MSKLTTYLRAFLNLAGGKAMPNTRHSYQEITGTGENQSFVSPINGYLEVQSAESNSRIALTGTTSWMFVSAMDTGIGTCGTFLPVAKGQNVTVWLTAGKSATLRWIKLIGGGINRLIAQAVRYVRGGAICLKASLKNCSVLCARWFLQGQHTQTTKYPAQCKSSPLTMVGLCSLPQTWLILPLSRFNAATLSVLYRVVAQHGDRFTFLVEKVNRSRRQLTERVNLSCESFAQHYPNNVFAKEVCHA